MDKTSCLDELAEGDVKPDNVVLGLRVAVHTLAGAPLRNRDVYA